MGKVVGALLAVLIGLALAGGVTVTVTSMNNPDSKLDLPKPASAGADQRAVDYGTR